MKEWKLKFAMLVMSMAVLAGCGEEISADAPRQQAQAGGVGCPTEPTVVLARRQVREDKWDVLEDGRVIYSEVGIERVLAAPPVTAEGWRSASAIPFSQTGSTTSPHTSFCGRPATRHRRVVLWRYDISEIGARRFYNNLVQGVRFEGGQFRSRWDMTHGQSDVARNAYWTDGRFFLQAKENGQLTWEFGLALSPLGVSLSPGSTFFPESVYRVVGTRRPLEPLSIELVGVERRGVVDEPPWPACQSTSLGCLGCAGGSALNGPRETRATYFLTCTSRSIVDEVSRMSPWDAHSLVFGGAGINGWRNATPSLPPVITVGNDGCLRCSVGVYEQR